MRDEAQCRWCEIRLRFIADFNPSKSEVAHLSGDTEVSFLPMEAIGDDGSLQLDARRALDAVQQGYTYFQDGDLVIAKITPCFENGKGALAEGLLNGIGFGTTELIVVRPHRDRVLGRYLHWLFSAPHFRDTATASMYGAGGQKRVPDAFVRDFRVALPSKGEQSAIAAFLDHETAKIDALVAEQERLIALLKEKRQAVISHAVTKGLDPNAPMKDSDVEWLGQVPAHWNLRRLKNLSPFITVGIVVNPSSYLADEGYPFIYGGDIREGVIDWQNARRISKASTIANSKTRIQAGDLLTVRVGAPGVTAVVPPECEGGNCASVMLIRKGPYDSRWLCYAMNTRIVRFQVEIVQYGAAQEQFNIAHAVNFWVPTPPKAEQAEIADFLDRECDRVGLLTIEAENAITLLRERRAALISAAVTGKIDVRGFVRPEQQAA